MDLFEYQGKSYLARFGLPVPTGLIAHTVEEAVEACSIVGYPAVIKAQVLTGGRGKAGGVKVVRGSGEAERLARGILGLDIKGHIVHRVWIERASDIAREYYASFSLDRTAKLDLVMCSARGGIEIEEVAHETPDAIARAYVNPLDGFSRAEADDLVRRAEIDEFARPQVAGALVDLYRCYVEGDADLVEVNPLIMTLDAQVRALDAKVTLDDAATFRHPEWAEFDQIESEDPRERLAHEKGLQYVGLDGSIGIIANGAGLAMSTCDVVQQVGGSPANFLDIGGGASAEVMAGALEVINIDENVRAIFVNIFGGITRGEEVANGILAALDRVEIKSPLVVRLDGTNAEKGRSILAHSGATNVFTSPTMLKAARLATKMAKEAS